MADLQRKHIALQVASVFPNRVAGCRRVQPGAVCALPVIQLERYLGQPQRGLIVADDHHNRLRKGRHRIAQAIHRC